MQHCAHMRFQKLLCRQATLLATTTIIREVQHHGPEYCFCGLSILLRAQFYLLHKPFNTEPVYVTLPMYVLAWLAVPPSLEVSLGTLYVHSLMI